MLNLTRRNALLTAACAGAAFGLPKPVSFIQAALAQKGPEAGKGFRPFKIYELRVYQAVPGQMAKLQARFRDQLPPIWEKHGIHAIGFWTTLIGKSSNQLTYILEWESLADLETRWTAFLNDPAWHKVRDEGERDGPIVASISNQILTPTGFSALK